MTKYRNLEGESRLNLAFQKYLSLADNFLQVLGWVMNTQTAYSEMTEWDCVVKSLVILIHQALLPCIKKN